MTRDHDPFTQALLSLRERVVRNVYGAGQPIVIVEEARRLKVSVTPVREALSRLSGEGFVERAASGGYFSPRLDAAIVRDRYTFQLTCLKAALALVAPAVVFSISAQPAATRSIFDQIIRRSGSSALADAYQRVSALLGVFASVEGILIPDREQEARELHRCLADPERRGLIDALERYHGRRIALAADVVTALGEGGSQADHPDT